MKYQSILVPYDGSSHASSALKVAVEMLKDNPAARLHVVTVIPFSTVPASIQILNKESYQTYVDAMVAQGLKSLHDKVDALMKDVEDRSDVSATTESSVAAGILRFAKEHGCDFIVMGRRGLGALRGMLGSVSFAVLREAEIPVLTVM